MSRNWLIVGFMIWGMLGISRADTFKLTTGETITGDVLANSANDVGVQVKVDEGKYERIPWASFSQDDLRKLSNTPKFQPFIEPFLEASPEERAKRTEVPNIHQPPRLQRPPPHSLLGALFSSSLGFLVLVVLYAANIYAGYEVAIFRARPPLLVAGLAAIPLLGFLAPTIFLAMPTYLPPRAETAYEEPLPTEAARGPGGTAAPTAATDSPETVNPMQSETVPHPAGLKLAHSETESAVKPAALPETVTFKRGQFTFNRRFFETKFSGFFGVVPRDAELDMVLLIKAARGEYRGQRISRIASNDLHLQVQEGEASQEVMIPFQEIQEIQLKHKDA